MMVKKMAIIFLSEVMVGLVRLVATTK